MRNHLIALVVYMPAVLLVPAWQRSLAESSEGDAIELYFEPGGAPDTYQLMGRNTGLLPITYRLDIGRSDKYRVLYARPAPGTLAPGDAEINYTIELLKDEDISEDLNMSIAAVQGAVEVSTDARYQLPCACDTSCTVVQAEGGTHQDWQRHAVDFEFPEGTLIQAIGDGSVVQVYDESEANCQQYSEACDSFTNYVWVLGADDLITEYAHLAPGGALVKEGDIVWAGDPIGRSGNTGYSMGPHLHVANLFVQVQGKRMLRVTSPMTFSYQGGESVLEAGDTYKRADCPQAVPPGP